ncbi:hypothetical protein [Paraburkholderia sp. SIMBA_030]|uniref:hypothetical protein n=1 Tax=Paraburkholderia sp. SIMBA_030 TaxID=3085773 RepID=UPI00397E3781
MIRDMLLHPRARHAHAPVQFIERFVEQHRPGNSVGNGGPDSAVNARAAGA